MSDTSAIVTGAASGLGAATATGLAEQGARVFGLDLDMTRAPDQRRYLPRRRRGQRPDRGQGGRGHRPMPRTAW